MNTPAKFTYGDESDIEAYPFDAYQKGVLIETLDVLGEFGGVLESLDDFNIVYHTSIHGTIYTLSYAGAAWWVAPNLTGLDHDKMRRLLDIEAFRGVEFDEDGIIIKLEHTPSYLR